MTIYPLAAYRKQVVPLFQQLWGATDMVVSSGRYDIRNLDGFVAVVEQQIAGVLSYVVRYDELEIISLDSLRPNQGIGSQLMQAAEQLTQEQQLHQITVITTNDNLHALAFYQKRGYQIKAVFPGAVAKARAIKPEIPLVAENGLPIQDELQLVKNIQE